jgi:hypothetical protein
LVRDRLIGRVEIDTVYLYVAPGASVSRRQVEKRRAMAPMPPGDARTPDMASVVEMLLVVIHKQKASASQIRGILRGKGLRVTDQQVEDVLDRYGLKKKSKSSPSTHSRK